MSAVTLAEAQARLPELIDQLGPSEELVILRDQMPIARLIGEAAPPTKPRQPGSAKGILTIVSEDDDHLADFKEYME